ncbi:DUF4402 domain-containing protein [Alteraurantiacibacter palmitatis]|uniref:DUF4402 domain-containing protein n=1 Tax=Alteraurantiacibacter palmitatis TaxID=2054628 RepID=A0ABV7E8B7_9SPHN
MIRPIRAASVADLSFGRIALAGGGAAGGMVTIDPRGGPGSYSGGVQPACGAEPGCQPHAARFAVSGEPGRSYRVILPETVEAHGQRSAARLTVHALTLHSLASAGEGTALLDAEGEGAFSVGGTLTVVRHASPDIYHATVPVTVTYD